MLQGGVLGKGRKFVEMNFSVERKREGFWLMMSEAVEAGSHHQAVARTCKMPGLYRAQEVDGRDPEHRDFWVPTSGAPNPV